MNDEYTKVSAFLLKAFPISIPRLRPNIELFRHDGLNESIAGHKREQLSYANEKPNEIISHY